MTLPAGLKAPIRTDVPLKSYTTFKIGGPARFFSEPCTLDELLQVLEFQRAEGLPLLIMGRGSNLLISDTGFQGMVLSLRKLEPDRFSLKGEGLLSVSGGMSLFRLSMVSQELGLSGAEFVCHIPGTVGGAAVMNAGFGRRGALYQEIKDILESITVLDLDSGGTIRTLRKDQICFEYRKTCFPGNFIVLEVLFRLTPKPKEEVLKEIKANFAYRSSVQDLRFPSAGSTFKNPKGFALTSGQLLDRAGMKKTRIGGAMVSERHANFFLNVDHAKSQDILELMSLAKRRVFEEFGIELEPEIKYIG